MIRLGFLILYLKDIGILMSQLSLLRQTEQAFPKALNGFNSTSGIRLVEHDQGLDPQLDFLLVI